MIIVLSTVVGLRVVDIRFLKIAFFSSIIIFICCFIYLLIQLDKQKAFEKKAYKNVISQHEIDCSIVVVVKNEGETIINTVKHYLSFPEKLHILIYDDESTDNSIEMIKGLGKTAERSVEIRKLVKRDIFVHPKAFGTEDAFNSVENDILLVIDADTIITHSDFIKAISALKNENADVLHIARRNDKKNLLVDRLSDIEELLNMAFHLTKFNNNQFGGSGYFVKSKKIKGLKYHEGITSEDTYVLKYLRDKGAKIKFFYTLFAHERAPKNYISMIKQRINWLNQSVPFYLQHHFFLATIMHSFFSLAVIGLLFPFSIGIIFSSTILSIFFSIEIALEIKLLKKSGLKVIYYTFLLVVNMALVICPVYLFSLFKSVISDSPSEIVKNQ